MNTLITEPAPQREELTKGGSVASLPEQHPLKPMFDNFQTLRAFIDKYQPGDRLMCIHDVSGKPDRLPQITFYADESREWMLDNFGCEGWLTDYVSCGFQHIFKMVAGVRVTLYDAYPVRAVEDKGPQPVNPGWLGVRVMEVAQ